MWSLRNLCRILSKFWTRGSCGYRILHNEGIYSAYLIDRLFPNFSHALHSTLFFLFCLSASLLHQRISYPLSVKTNYHLLSSNHLFFIFLLLLISMINWGASPMNVVRYLVWPVDWWKNFHHCINYWYYHKINIQLFFGLMLWFRKNSFNKYYGHMLAFSEVLLQGWIFWGIDCISITVMYSFKYLYMAYN